MLGLAQMPLCCIPIVLSCDEDGCATNIWGQTMQNDHQSSESVIQSVDTHLVFMLVLLSVRQGNCLELTLFKQINLVIWNYLIGQVLLRSSNEQASKEPVLMERH